MPYFFGVCAGVENASSRSCHPEKKKKANFLFMLQAFIDFFHSFFMCVHFCTFMHIILNEMSQEKYLPFAHKFFPSFSVQIPDVVNIARLSLTLKRISLVQAFSIYPKHGYMVGLCSQFSNECRL
jgi:hypothetical protein